MSAALGTLETYSHSERKRLSGVALAVAGWIGELFGAQKNVWRSKKSRSEFQAARSFNQ